jgi:hypothetical protein
MSSFIQTHVLLLFFFCSAKDHLFFYSLIHSIFQQKYFNPSHWSAVVAHGCMALLFSRNLCCHTVHSPLCPNLSVKRGSSLSPLPLPLLLLLAVLGFELRAYLEPTSPALYL